jgi:NAD(P)-dependent dehydrogenase (short-subunit alcohol dehydrogenase family)
MQIDLSGKNILVTGASNGIGRAIATQLAASGAKVAIHYNSNRTNAEKMAAELSNGAMVFGADLAKEKDCFRLFDDVKMAFGRIDAIVNNAGIFKGHPVQIDNEKWLDVWKQTMDINLTSAAILTKLAINHFTENGGGRLIYIASRAAFRGETEDYLAYAASKGGMVSLARSVARSFGKYNIKAFTIAPGFTRTEMAESFIREHGEGAILKELSLQELTEPTDISPLVTLMCSGMLDHATGSTVDINAGSYMR